MAPLARLESAFPHIENQTIMPSLENGGNIEDPTIAAEIVTPVRQEMLSIAALSDLIEANGHTAFATVAERAIVVAKQRLQIAIAHTMRNTLRQEIPLSCDVVVDDTKATYAFDAQVTQKVRVAARKERASAASNCATGAQPSVTAEGVGAAASERPQSRWNKVAMYLRHIGLLKKRLKPSEDYYNASVEARKQQELLVGQAESNDLPSYTCEEMQIIQGALTERLAIADGPDKLEAQAALTLIDKQPSPVISSVHELVEQRGATGALRSMATRQVVRVVTALGDTITLYEPDAVMMQ